MAQLTYMPLIGNGPEEPTGQSESFADQLYELVQPYHPNRNALLDLAAQEHAEDMAQRNYFSHVTPEGVWSNERVREVGYHLPDDWLNDKNYVESIAAGQPTAEEAWDAWMHSPSHKTHLLGATDFFAQQTNVGVGYAHNSNSTYQHYWVIVTAPPEE